MGCCANDDDDEEEEEEEDIILMLTLSDPSKSYNTIVQYTGCFRRNIKYFRRW
jgi:hypothetical protein